MAGKPIGAVAMLAAERQRRYRAKARALRDAATPPADSNTVTAKADGSEPDQQDDDHPDARASGDLSDGLPLSDLIADGHPPGIPGRPGADYPRMLYHADGRTLVVDGPEAHDQLIPDGWGTVPLAVHLRRPVTHHGVLGASHDHPLAAIIREVLTQVLDERGVGRTRVIP
jgi:hypothetical protein